MTPEKPTIALPKYWRLAQDEEGLWVASCCHPLLLAERYSVVLDINAEGYCALIAPGERLEVYRTPAEAFEVARGLYAPIVEKREPQRHHAGKTPGGEPVEALTFEEHPAWVVFVNGGVQIESWCSGAGKKLSPEGRVAAALENPWPGWGPVEWVPDARWSQDSVTADDDPDTAA